VETLFGRGAKHLHRFAVDLFEKFFTKFYENCTRFIGDIIEYILFSFFPDIL